MSGANDCTAFSISAGVLGPVVRKAFKADKPEFKNTHTSRE